jgi:hypothetical protein
MRHSKLAYSLSIVVLFGTLTPRIAEGKLRILAASGQPAPDGNGVLGDLGLPLISNSGAVVFSAQVNQSSQGTNDDGGLYRWNNGALGLVLREGQAAPDGNGTFATRSNFSINAAGELAFSATLNGTTGLDADSGIFRSTPASPLVQIARGGQVAPDSQSAFNDFYNFVTMADNGQVVYSGTLRRLSDGGPAGTAIFRSAGGAATELARQGQSVDGSSLGAFTNSRARGNASGNASFGTSLGAHAGIFRADGQDITTLVVTDVTPVIGHNATVGGPFWNTLNNAGDVGFRGSLEGPSDLSSLFVASDDGVRVVVHEGQSLPSGPGNIDHYWWTNDHILSLNDNRQLAFEALLSGVPGPDPAPDAIFFGNGVSLTEVVRTGTTAPDHDGVFADFLLVEVINNLDHVAFTAAITNTQSGQAELGLYLGDGSTVRQIARQGQLIDGVAIAALGFRHGVQQSRGLNDADQLAFRATLADGRQLILLHTPEPALPGDYDLDGDVDDHDYAVWKADFGGTGEQNADGNGDGIVNAADYTLWRNHLGAGSGNASSVQTVPEPGVWSLAVMLAILLGGTRGHRPAAHI